MKGSTLVLVFVLSVVSVFASRWLTRSHSFFSSDGVQYALAMDEFSILKHQPHPPGYVFLVYAGKLIRYVVHDANLALILVNIFLSALACVLIFFFAYHSSQRDKLTRAWIAWALLLPNVMFWFYGSIADIYVPEFFGTLLFAYCCYRSINSSKKFFYIFPLALALLGAIKLTAMVFLFPLALYTVIRSPFKSKILPVLLFLISFLAWFTPFVLSQGIAFYFSSVWQTFDISKKTAMEEGVSSFRALIRNGRDVTYYLILAAGVFNVIAVGILFLLKRRPKRLRKDQIVFGLLWLAPYGLFLTFIYIGNLGYLLLFAGASALFVSYYYVQSTSRQFLILLVFLNLLFSSAHFLLIPRLEPQEIGEGLKFQEKTWKQRILAQANLFLFPVLGTIRQNDADTEWIINKVRSLCPSGTSMNLMTTDAPFGNWRKLQYYFPENMVVRLYEQNKNPFMIARGRKFIVHQEKSLEIHEPCKTLWFLTPIDSRIEQLQKKTSLHEYRESSRSYYWTQGPLEVSFADNSTIKIR